MMHMQAEYEERAASCGLQPVAVSQPLLQLFARFGLVPALDSLAVHAGVLVSDQERHLSAGSRQLLGAWRGEIAHAFTPFVRPEEVMFAKLPAGHEGPLLVLPGRLVFDIGLTYSDRAVAALRADDPGWSCAGIGEDSCRCVPRMLTRLLAARLPPLPDLDKQPAGQAADAKASAAGGTASRMAEVRLLSLGHA